MKKIFLLYILFLFNLDIKSQESVFVQTEDEWKIHFKYKKPKTKELGTIILIHSQKSNYTEFKKWFEIIERYGYGWASIDLRGHGISIYKVDGTTQTYQDFSVSGFDNEYNKMIRDIDACVIYLSSMGITEDKITLLGINLGANLAIKYSAINSKIKSIIVINPSININDILSINPIRLYKDRPILFVGGQNYKKKLSEIMLLYNITKKSTGIKNTFILIEYSITTADNISNSTIYKILNWINNPVLPDIAPENLEISTSTVSLNNDTTTITSPYIIKNEDSENE